MTRNFHVFIVGIVHEKLSFLLEDSFMAYDAISRLMPHILYHNHAPMATVFPRFPEKNTLSALYQKALTRDIPIWQFAMQLVMRPREGLRHFLVYRNARFEPAGASFAKRTA